MTKKEMFFRIILPVTCLLVVVAIALGVYFGVYYKPKTPSIDPPPTQESPLDDIDIQLRKLYTFTKCTIDGQSGYSLSTRRSQYPETLELPDTYRDLPVISVNGFMGHKEIKRVVLPVMCMQIEGGNGFMNSGLTEVTIPSSVKKIGHSSFSACEELTSLIIEDGVNKIEYAAFDSCKKLTTVVIPDSVTEIEFSAFYGCSSLTSVVLSNNITTISDYLFVDCTSLSSINIPQKVINIGKDAFRGCSALEEVNFESKTSWYSFSIGVDAFVNVKYLCKLVINGTNRSIVQSAISHLSELNDKYNLVICVEKSLINNIANDYGFVIEEIAE